jgi:2-oxoisovalerate dehydrogenase E1 component beta subunit
LLKGDHAEIGRPCNCRKDLSRTGGLPPGVFEEHGVTTSDAIRQESRRNGTRRKFSFGEDVGIYGGAFKVTTASEKFSETRCRYPISESAIVGAAIGAALMGLRPLRKCSLQTSSPALRSITNFAAKCRYRWGAESPRGPGPGGGIHGGPFHSQNPEMHFVHTRTQGSVPSTAYDAKAC